MLQDALRPFSAALACCAGVHAAPAMADDWTTTGGPSGGAVTAIAAGADRAMAGAAGGVFLSEGAGPWTLVAPGASPSDARAILAVADDFYITTASGGLFRTDGVSGEPRSTPLDRRIVELRADGGDLYAIGGETFGHLYASVDGAASWELIEAPQDIAHVHISGDIIMAAPGSAVGLLRSPDGGETWQMLEHGVHLPWFFGTQQFAGAGDIMYAAVGSFTGRAEVIRSGDGGRSWSTAALGLDALQILDLQAGEEHIYAATVASDRASVDIWRAPLAGGAWMRRAASVHHDITGPGAAMAIAGDSLLLATSGAGVLRSTDGGATWLPASDGLSASTARAMAAAADELIVADGNPSRIWRFDADARAWSDIAFSSSSGEILALGAMDDDSYLAGVRLHSATGGIIAGVRLSDDGGRTWRAANSGVPSYEGLGGMQLREFNAFAARGATWLGASGPGAEWPPPGSKGAAAVETGGGGVIRSTNSAASWQRSTAGLPIIGRDGQGAPHYPAALSLIATSDGFLMGTKGHGVYRSLDDGLSWTGSALGIPPSTWTFGPAPIVSLAEFGSALYAATDAPDVTTTVLRSTDGGASWSPVAGLPEAPARALMAHDGRLFAALGVIVSGPGAGSGAGVWATSDGVSWSEVGEALAGRQVSHLAPFDGALTAAAVGLGVWELGDSACAADLDGDGALTFFDFLAFQDLFAAGDPRADFTGDGTLDFFDFLAFQNAFAAGCA